MFSLFNFSSIFPGGSADPICPYVRTPMPKLSLSDQLMSDNERQSQTNAVINDKLQRTVVTYLSCGGIVNNQIKKGYC